MGSETGEKYPSAKVRMSWAAEGHPRCPTCRFQMGPPDDPGLYFCYECGEEVTPEDIRKLQIHLADAPPKAMPKSKKSRPRSASGGLSALMDSWARGIRGLFGS